MKLHEANAELPLCSNHSFTQQLEQICPSVTAERTACCILPLPHLNAALLKTERKTKDIYYYYPTIPNSRLLNTYKLNCFMEKKLT